MPTHLVPDVDLAVSATRAQLSAALAEGDTFAQLALASAREEVRTLLPDLDPRTPPYAVGAALIAATSHAAAVVARTRHAQGLSEFCRDSALVVNLLTAFGVAFLELGEEQDAAAGGDRS